MNNTFDDKIVSQSVSDKVEGKCCETKDIGVIEQKKEIKLGEETLTNKDENHYNLIQFSLEDVFVNLTLIARIDVGNKLVRYDKYINIDTSYFQSITRWLNGQNRTDNIKFTSALLTKAFEYSDILTKQKDDVSRQNLLRLSTSLSNAINGLTNLSQTYYYDKLAQSEIEVMINNIRTKLNIQSKHIQFVEGEKNDENIDINHICNSDNKSKMDIVNEIKQVVATKKEKKDERKDEKRINENNSNENLSNLQHSQQSSYPHHVTTNILHNNHSKKKSL